MNCRDRIPRNGLRILMTLLTLVSSIAAAGEPWPIKEFEVVAARPWDQEIFKERSGGLAMDTLRLWRALLIEQLGSDLDPRLQPDEPLNLQLKEDMEAYLRAAAQQLEAWGFPPPRLEPVVTRKDGQRAYRVYYVDNPVEGTLGMYMADNSLWYELSSRTVIILNGSRGELSQDGGPGGHGARLTDTGRSTLGHELFHAVQFAMPFYRRALGTPGAWVTEGTAEAVGSDLVRVIEGRRPDIPTALLWGLRDYAQASLPVEASSDGLPPRAGYMSASFWRYLAELHARPRHGKPGTAAQAADYGYLAGLFDRLPAAAGTDEELRWLERGLQAEQRIAKGLKRIFPDFISTYAGYGDGRAARLTAKTWQESSFDGGCDPLVISPQQMKAHQAFTLEPLGARCFSVDATAFTQPVTFSVQARAATEVLAGQLTLGTAGGQRVSHDPPVVQTPPIERDALRWTATTVFLSTPGSPQVLVLANVAEAPWTTAAQDVEIVVATGGHEGSLRPPAASGPAEEMPPPKASPQSKQASQRSSARSDLRRAAKRVVQQGVLTTEVQRQPDPPAHCPAREAGLNLCGPQLVITLSQAPGSMDALSATLSSGGRADQLLTSGDALRQALPEAVANVLAAGRHQETTEAGRIVLTLPAVDYGFTGTLRHVQVSVTREGGGELLALGPRDLEPGPMTLFAPAGEVRIDEYSPAFLSGHYRAALVDPGSLAGGRIPRSSREEYPSLPVTRVIEGHFAVAAPWRGDERTLAAAPGRVDTSLEEDLAEWLPSGDDSPDPPGDDDPTGPSPTASRPGATVVPAELSAGCDCSCAAFERMNEQFESILAEAGAGSLPQGDQLGLLRCSMACPQWAACE